MKPVAPHPPLEHYYGDAAAREGYVRELFDETAPWYDWAIRLLSFGSGDWYRREALRRAGLMPGMKLLDLATGTGVVARSAVQLTGDPRSIVGADASIGMLRAGRMASPRVQAAAEAIPFGAGTFDRITIGFALRHFADLAVVFSDCLRVLKPGGRLVILEITAPASRIGRSLLGAYMGVIAPAIIRVRTGDPKTARLFRYYWETTRDCVRPAVILDAMRAAGFEDVRRETSMAIFSEYSGRRPD